MSELLDPNPSALLEPVPLGAVKARNRVFMAPLTRMRAAGPGELVTDLHVEYYRQRASAGLVISEGTQISNEGQGYADTPGIFSPAQVEAWSRVTDAVHAEGGLMAAQLWHTGWVGHPSLHDGALPVSASSLPVRTRTSLKDEHGRVVRADVPVPRALETDEIPRLVQDYRRAAAHARDAGFDLVEVHAAHGYLLHQFLSAASNHRTDAYGGSPANRRRLLLEVVDAIADEWSADRIGVRLSPVGRFNGLDDPTFAQEGLEVAAALATRDLAYLHLSEPDWAGGPALERDYRESLRAAYPGTLVGAGSYDADKAVTLLAAGLIDAAAFGRTFIANPDLPERLVAGARLNDQRPELFYGGGAEGYVDYPVMQPGR